MKIDQFKTSQEITWCPGCGNFGLWLALRQALAKLGFQPSDVLAIYGIGCHGHMVNYLNTFGFQGLHGRTLPVAQGAKIANKNLNIVAIAGDGDQLGEGGNHLIHAARRNSDITCIIHNNQIYGLTVGQASPTSETGFKSRSSPRGVIEKPVNPISLAIAAGASFVARGFAGDVNHLTEIFVEGIKHKGFSLIEVLQPCVTLNYLNTFAWFKQRIFKLDKKNHNPSDKVLAQKRALEWGNKIPLGVFYKEARPTFEEELLRFEEKPLAERQIDKISIGKLLKEFA